MRTSLGCAPTAEVFLLHVYAAPPSRARRFKRHAPGEALIEDALARD